MERRSSPFRRSQPLPFGARCPERSWTARSIARELGSDLLFCAGVAAFLTIIFAAYQDPTPRAWLFVFLFNMIISTSIGMGLSNLYRFAQPAILARFPGRFAYYASHFLIIVTGVGLGVEVALRIIDSLGGPSPGDLRSDVFRVGVVVATVIVIITVSFERLRERARSTELLAQQAQREALRAQLEALQARTNPHFLFNSLNTVAGLIEEDPRAAETVLEKLSGLFRYSLEGSKTEWVRLEREIAAVRDYLEVERVRLGERLRANVVVEPGVERILVPPLLLQPLVENAILHAVAPRASGGSLTVSARRAGSTLRLAVEDDGPGLGNSAHRGSGTSLSDLAERLAMVYGAKAALETQSPTADGDVGGGVGCRVTVRLPLEGAGAEAGDAERTVVERDRPESEEIA